MHNRITPERYSTLSGIHDLVRSVQLVARMAHPPSTIPCTVHLDARPKHARNAIQPLSGIHDFVQRVARYGEFTGVHYFKKVYVDYSELR